MIGCDGRIPVPASTCECAMIYLLTIYHAESGQGGPCLTDAAQEAALDASFVGGRYAAAQTHAATILAAYFSGGVIETSGKAFTRRLTMSPADSVWTRVADCQVTGRCTYL